MTIIEIVVPSGNIEKTKKMKLEYEEDGISNHSDFSNDSQNSQISTSTDFITTIVTSTYLQTSASSFLTLEGLNSGVPTRTTPTLTPTTLRNIEQTFSELQPKTESHENEAGFVPPLVHSIGNNQYISASDVDVFSNKSTQSLWQNSLSQSSSDCDTRSTPPPLLNNKTSFSNTIHPTKTTTSSSGSSTTSSPNQTRRNMGGRKPAKDLNISPEEEERRRIRRERNKAAAARCRKRRVDHTNSLIKETEELESKRQALQDELQELTMIRDELEYVLKQHRSSSNCRKRTGSPPDVKPFVNNDQNNTTNTIFNNHHHQQQQQQQQHQQRCNGGGERVKTEYIESMEPMYDDSMFLLPTSPNKKIMLSSTVAITKPLRPNSLNVGATAPHLKQTASEIAGGLQVSTPSNGMIFNYESLMLGGTGLTPVATCSTQQRNIPVSIADLSSPEACGPPKLVSL